VYKISLTYILSDGDVMAGGCCASLASQSRLRSLLMDSQSPRYNPGNGNNIETGRFVQSIEQISRN